MKKRRYLIMLAAALVTLSPYAGAQEASYLPADVVPEEYLREFGTDSFFSCSEISDELFRFMEGRSFKEVCPVGREDLRYLRLLHRDIQGRAVVGEMVVNKSIAYIVLTIFQELFENSYPIEKIRLVDWYDGDDEASMQDNNSSAFNARNVGHSGLISKHSYGEAVDINPLYNPEYKVSRSGKIVLEPTNAAQYLDRAADFPYKIAGGDLCHQLFVHYGFSWGGGWAGSKDYQHFELLR